MNRIKSLAPPDSALFALIVIAAVGLAVYSNTFHVPFQFDDPSNISGKPYVKDIGRFFDPSDFNADSSYIMRRVVYFTFAVNYWLHRTDVAGYHIVNITIHLINAFLVYFLVILTFRTPYFRGRGSGTRNEETGPSFIALFTALLFVSHPIQTQAVTYIVQRLASLATLFYLLSLVMYIRSRLASQKAGKLTGYVFSLLSAVLAMESKEIAFTLPVVIALYEFMFFTGAVKKRVLSLIPFLLTMLIIPMQLTGLGKPTGDVIGDVSDAMRVGTPLSRWDYLFTQFRVIVTYIRLLFFPLNQNLDYDYPTYHSFFTPPVFLSFLFLVSLFGGAMYLLYKSRQGAIGNGSWGKGSSSSPSPYHLSPIACYRLISFGIFWFFITLSVESSVIPIADVIYEHRLYLPSTGFFIAVVTMAFLVRDRLGAEKKKAIIIALIAFVVILSVLGYHRNRVWRSEVVLWEDVVRKSPGKARAYNGLGLSYKNEGNLDKAFVNFRRAVEIDPYYAVAYNGLGTVYFAKNLPVRALEEFTRALALEPDNVIFMNNRGLAYAAIGEFDKAIAVYLEAIELEPFYAEAHHNLGFAYSSKGLFEKAIAEFSTALRFDPDFPEAHYNLGNVYMIQGDTQKALREMREAVRLKPDDAMAHYGLGTVYGNLGLLDEAIKEFRVSIALKPGFSEAVRNLDIALKLKEQQ